MSAPIRPDSILNRIVRATQVDTIVHTFLETNSVGVPSRLLHEINVIGTLNLLAAAGSHRDHRSATWCGGSPRPARLRYRSAETDLAHGSAIGYLCQSPVAHPA